MIKKKRKEKKKRGKASSQRTVLNDNCWSAAERKAARPFFYLMSWEREWNGTVSKFSSTVILPEIQLPGEDIRWNDEGKKGTEFRSWLDDIKKKKRGEDE